MGKNVLKSGGMSGGTVNGERIKEKMTATFKNKGAAGFD